MNVPWEKGTQAFFLGQRDSAILRYMRFIKCNTPKTVGAASLRQVQDRFAAID